MRIARLSLGVLLLLMAAGQAVTFGDFTAALSTYGTGLPVSVLAVAVIVAEVVGGTALLTPGARARRLGAQVTVGVAVFWLVMAVQAFARGLAVPNCGCFGRYLSQELRWWVLLEDVYLVGLASWVLRASRGPSTPTEAAEAASRETANATA